MLTRKIINCRKKALKERVKEEGQCVEMESLRGKLPRKMRDLAWASEKSRAGCACRQGEEGLL
jgi:hypothetical protein